MVILNEGLSGEAPSAGRSRHESAEGIRAKILHLWFARKAALDEADTVTAQARVEELRAYMLQEGITADAMVARGFSYEGYENLREGNYERAREAFDQGRSFDPYLPQAQVGYAWSLLRSGRGIFAFLNEYARGLGLSWRQFVTDEVQISNFSVVSALSMLCGLMAFSLVVIARCQGRARHDLYEAARRVLPAGAARVVGWAVFLLPLLVWAGGLWLLLYWLAICFRYMRAPEKAVAVCVFLMLALAPMGVEAVVERVEASTDPEMRVVVASMQAGYNPQNLRLLQEVVAAHPEASELHLLLGTAYARGDQLGEAFDEFQKVLDANPSSASGLVDVGNIYFRLGEFAQAVNHYKRAAGIQPDLVSAAWNMHLAQTELLHFAEADASLARARSLDQGLTGKLLARKKQEKEHTLLLEEVASLGIIKSELRAPRPGAPSRWSALINPLSLASGVGLLLALGLSLSGVNRIAEACVRCGRAHCPRCRVDSGASGCCLRCVHLFMKTSGISAEARAEEMSRLQRRDRVTAFVRRFLSLALPGSGLILAGRVWLGLPVMVGWIGAIIFLLAQDRLLLPASVPVTDLPPPGVVVSCALLGILWIAGNAVSTRRRVMVGGPHGA